MGYSFLACLSTADGNRRYSCAPLSGDALDRKRSCICMVSGLILPCGCTPSTCWCLSVLWELPPWFLRPSSQHLPWQLAQHSGQVALVLSLLLILLALHSCPVIELDLRHLRLPALIASLVRQWLNLLLPQILLRWSTWNRDSLFAQIRRKSCSSCKVSIRCCC